MKTSLLIVKSAILLCWLLVGNAVAQQASEVVARGPGSQGSKEYAFKSNAPKGSLAVFRRDAYLDDKLIDRYEVVVNVPGGGQFQKAVFISSSGIKVDDGNMYLPTAFTQKAIAFRSESACVKTVFEGVRNKRTYAITYIFTMKDEPSGDVIRRVPATASSQMKKMDTNVAVSGWTFCVDYSNISHPMSTALGELD